MGFSAAKVVSPPSHTLLAKIQEGFPPRALRRFFDSLELLINAAFCSSKCPNRLVNGYASSQPCVIPSFLLWKWDFPPQKVVSPSSHTLPVKFRDGFTPLGLCEGFSTVWSRAQMRLNMNRFRGICARERAGQTRFFSRTHRQSHRRLHGNRPQSISSRRLSSKVRCLRTPAALPQEACSCRVQRKQAAPPV